MADQLPLLSHRSQESPRMSVRKMQHEIDVAKWNQDEEDDDAEENEEVYEDDEFFGGEADEEEVIETLRNEIRQDAEVQKRLRRHSIRTSVVVGEQVALAKQGDLLMYTQAAQEKRAEVKSHPALREELLAWWKGELKQSEHSRMTKNCFLNICMVLSRYLLREDVPVSAKEARQTALNDWDEDPHLGPDATDLGFDQFCNSMIELADLWTSSTEIEDYIGFTKRIRAQVTKSIPARLLHMEAYLQKRVPKVKSAFGSTLPLDRDDGLSDEQRKEKILRVSDKWKLGAKSRFKAVAEAVVRESTPKREASRVDKLVVREDTRFIARLDLTTVMDAHPAPRPGARASAITPRRASEDVPDRVKKPKSMVLRVPHEAPLRAGSLADLPHRSAPSEYFASYDALPLASVGFRGQKYIAEKRERYSEEAPELPTADERRSTPLGIESSGVETARVERKRGGSVTVRTVSCVTPPVTMQVLKAASTDLTPESSYADMAAAYQSVQQSVNELKLSFERRDRPRSPDRAASPNGLSRAKSPNAPPGDRKSRLSHARPLSPVERSSPLPTARETPACRRQFTPPRDAIDRSQNRSPAHHSHSIDVHTTAQLVNARSSQINLVERPTPVRHSPRGDAAPASIRHSPAPLPSTPPPAHSLHSSQSLDFGGSVKEGSPRLDPRSLPSSPPKHATQRGAGAGGALPGYDARQPAGDPGPAAAGPSSATATLRRAGAPSPVLSSSEARDRGRPRVRERSQFRDKGYVKDRAPDRYSGERSPSPPLLPNGERELRAQTTRRGPSMLAQQTDLAPPLASATWQPLQGSTRSKWQYPTISGNTFHSGLRPLTPKSSQQSLAHQATQQAGHAFYSTMSDQPKYKKGPRYGNEPSRKSLTSAQLIGQVMGWA